LPYWAANAANAANATAANSGTYPAPRSKFVYTSNNM
jgi:hypothetical protein